MKRFLLLAVICSAWCSTELGATSSPPVRAAADSPNVVYILADDMGYGDVSCLNAKAAWRTTHMGRLASDLTPDRPSALRRYCELAVRTMDQFLNELGYLEKKRGDG